MEAENGKTKKVFIRTNLIFVGDRIPILVGRIGATLESNSNADTSDR